MSEREQILESVTTIVDGIVEQLPCCTDEIKALVSMMEQLQQSEWVRRAEQFKREMEQFKRERGG